MAKVDYLLQGISNDNHIKFFTELLSFDNINKVIISVAFMKHKWLSLVKEHLQPFYDIIEMYVGIRNEMTSIQAISGLLAVGINPYLVDTGTSSYIYHPKFFVACSNTEARVIIGSANATSGGFYKNIEASALVYLNLNSEEDLKFLQKILDSVQTLKTLYPKNVIHIDSQKEADQIFNEGRLIDERLIKKSVSSFIKNSIKIESVPRMLLKDYKIKEPVIQYQKTEVESSNNLVLLWESKPLKERDLNIPSGSNTNYTGSMSLTKGNMNNLDQRYHFRKVIFNNLNWKYDTNPNKSHIERAYASFEFIIKGIFYGTYKLEISHNTKTDTPTYKQRNFMTQLHWGDARHIIARHDLLGHILQLYKSGTEDGQYSIIIE